MNTTTFTRPWHKNFTISYDNLKSQTIDCGQICAELEGVSVEAIASQLTSDEFVEFKASEDVLLALVHLVGIDLIKNQLAAIETEL